MTRESRTLMEDAPYPYPGPHDDCMATVPHFHDRPYRVGDWAASGLAEAWAAVEGALPEGATFGVTSTHTSVQSGRYVATTDYGPPQNGYAYADTPAAALHALVAALRTPKPEGEPT